MEHFEAIKNVIKSLRPVFPLQEESIHAMLAQALSEKGISFVHEAKLGPRCRIDFLCADVGIEIKKARPNKHQLLQQLERYLESDRIRTMIVLSEKDVPLPDTILGKSVFSISLQKNMSFIDKESVPANTAVIASPEAENQADNIKTTMQAIPGYLLPNSEMNGFHGSLSYHKGRKHWVITAAPYVTELAKRLFPGSAKAKRGVAYFSDNPRLVGEVNWLMQRYPLQIVPKDQEHFFSQLKKAQSRAAKLENLRQLSAADIHYKTEFAATLLPFQKEGTRWLLQSERGLLADEMGLGKTIQTLALIASRGTYPVIIIVPPHLITNWQSEIHRFLKKDGKELSCHVFTGLKPYAVPKADIYLMHYLLLRAWKNILPNIGFQLVVFDEIQELRHSGTEKYSAASLLSESCERVIGLSGTPIYNHGGEIWNVINILDYHLLGDWESFTREWCYGYGNSIVAKPQILGEFLRNEGIMLRRSKGDVLKELPEKRRLVQEIDLHQATYRSMMKSIIGKLEEYKNAEYLSPQEKALLEGNISNAERQATGLAKAPYVAQFTRALLENGEKVLLFAHHHAVMDYYKKDLKAFSPAFITGRETGSAKEKSIERFMNGKTDLCCISLRAASGLNLQRASCVVFGELDWSPAVHSQAEDRAHRIGQKDSLLCYYLVASDGSDADMQDALGLKVSQFMQLMGEKEQDDSIVQENATFARKHVQHILEKLDKGLII